MKIETKEIEIRKLRANDGSVEGLPRNPRKISKKKLEQLKKSVQDAPEMLKLRELIVVENGGAFVVIAGNQRLEAAKALGLATLPCKVLPNDTPAEKLREYAIKDNLPFGEDDWEVLSGEWDVAELEEWGMEVPGKLDKNPYVQNLNIPIYDIKGEKPAESDCIDLKKVDKLIQRINSAEIPDIKKSMLIACAYRFADINFSNMAEYYAHEDREMQELMEMLALVIVDFNKAIEYGLVEMDERMKEIYNEEL